MEVSEYTDALGNRCGRLFVPSGRVGFRHEAIVEDSGQLASFTVWTDEISAEALRPPESGEGEPGDP